MAPRAPDLIRQVKARFSLSQKDLEKVLGIRQQAVSDYEMGKVKKEQYAVIDKLEGILAGKIVVEPSSARKAARRKGKRKG